MAPQSKARASTHCGQFIAVDRTANRKVIASAACALTTIKKAKQTGKSYTIAYVPPAGKKYIY